MEYRLYLLGPDCRICSPARGFEAHDDEAALEIAREVFRSGLTPHHGFELWQGPRRVHTENC